MAYNEHVETILATAEEAAELLTCFYTPISEGDKNINDENIGEDHVESWLRLNDQVKQTIEDTEIAWALNEENNDEDVESEE